MSESTAAKKTRKPAKPAEHPKYSDMVRAAITSLKERNGSSRQAIIKFIKANYKVGGNSGVHVKMTLKRMSDRKEIVHTKGIGASGSFKINKAVKEEKPKKKPAKKPAAKKQAAKKKPAAKKPAAKKPAAKKSPKKAKKTTAEKAKKPAKKPAAKSKSAAKSKPTAKKPVAKKPAKKAAKKPAAKKAAKSPKK